MNRTTTPVVAGHYRLSEDAYVRLGQLRDELRLLETLTRPRAAADDGPDATLALAPRVLAQCFGTLAARMDVCLDEATWLSARTGQPRGEGAH